MTFSLANALQVIGKALEVGADSSQYPENWIFHSREKKPGKAFVDGLYLYLIPIILKILHIRTMCEMVIIRILFYNESYRKMRLHKRLGDVEYNDILK
jgi:hypothetical protein